MNSKKLFSFWKSVKTAFLLMFDKRVPKSAKLIPLFALVYIVSPIDFIPDFLAIPGLLDDLGVFMGALYVFYMLIPKEVLGDYMQGKSGKKVK